MAVEQRIEPPRTARSAASKTLKQLALAKVTIPTESQETYTVTYTFTAMNSVRY
jgi:hypothetical protein